MYHQERNRLEGREGFVEDEIRTHMEELRHRIQMLKRVITEHIEQHPKLCQQKALLLSIPGIGEKTIAQLLATCGAIHEFPTAKKVSGVLRSLPPGTPIGQLREQAKGLVEDWPCQSSKGLIFPGPGRNEIYPMLKALRQRLLTAGKPKMVIVGAAMRKLLHLIYGVLNSGAPFRSEVEGLPA